MVVLCADSERIRYRYAGKTQSLDLTPGATGWRKTLTGSVTGC